MQQFGSTRLCVDLWILLYLYAVRMQPATARIMSAGAGYVGSGYNLLLGNPDGSHMTSGGPDSGLLPTKIILQKTLSTGYCPDEAICTEVASDVSDDQYALVTDLEQFQKLYSTAWDYDTEEPLLPIESVYAGMESPQTKEARDVIEKTGDIILDKRKLTVMSEFRFNYKENRRLTTEFVTELCDLPLIYKFEVYRRFIASWGSHVMVAAKLGRLDIVRYKIPFNILNNLMLRVPILTKMSKMDIALSTLSYNSSDFQDILTIQTLIDLLVKTSELDSVITKWKFSTGSDAVPAPIHMNLRRLDYFIARDYAEGPASEKCPQLLLPEVLNMVQANVRRAICDYPIYTAAAVAYPFTRTFKLAWPKGTYALIKNQNCPETGPSHVWYGPGTLVLPDALQVYTLSLSPTEFDMDLNPNGELTLRFCVKLADTTEGSYEWPAGSYCVFKKRRCPTGFTEGAITTVYARVTLANDALPDGNFDGSSHSLEFCCRNDRAVDQAIILPTAAPFTLLSTGAQCQKVQGMQSALRIQSLRKGVLSGNFPFITSTDRQTMNLHFCYYTPWTREPV
ncbi:uncharacterized protein LOC129581376 [Paramacrobiotus metropolitanus]|uniref:uncharacterized protein LOC129581376 n=1 Tax=Paramacrobiotus metropolitanus TaxID=2943436 RepID=UPI0024463911|nr:uncharacterized protein LOC129581376 [Paramacrobiotus metropolitanus]